jgi:putative aldouronate transport system permease protein
MYWNDFFSTVLYINKKELWSLQAYLRNMLTNTAEAMSAVGVNINLTPSINATTIKAASIIIATVPILIVYPFLQKYFVKGVMIGGVKG